MLDLRKDFPGSVVAPRNVQWRFQNTVTLAIKKGLPAGSLRPATPRCNNAGVNTVTTSD